MTTFFRLLTTEDKAAALTEAVTALTEGELDKAVYVVEQASFRQVPGAPFAYWTSEVLRKCFQRFPSFEKSGDEAWVGLQTNDDFRWLRLWWEVPDDSHGRSRTNTLLYSWVPFAKGGAFARYYIDIHLVVDWTGNGGNIKSWKLAELARGRITANNSKCWNETKYFRPGITWSRRTQGGLSLRVLPAGCIFADKGPAIFAPDEQLLILLALTNSTGFAGLVSLQMAFGSYEVGVLQRTPIPDVSGSDADHLDRLARACVDLKRDLDRADETSHVFHLPALLQTPGATLAERQAAWQARLDAAATELAAHQREIDDIAFRLYGIADADRRAIEESLAKKAEVSNQTSDEEGMEDAEAGEEDADAEDEGAEAPPMDLRALAHDLLSYAVGAALGRWDVRYATGARLAPVLPDPFAPLPVCSPGMLQGADGLPLTEPPPGYPLAVDADGILTDDPEHRDDIVRRVRDVLRLVFPAGAEAIEDELAAALGVPALRDYIRRGFFDAHIRRYSKSRRKAPIYWLLQSPRRHYGLWLYLHRLTPDTLYKALALYAEPRLTREQARLAELQAAQKAAGTAGRGARQAAAAVAAQVALLADLQDFRDRLAAAAHLNLTPNLNDGVLLTLAPLHACVPWREPRAAWTALLAGKYPWSSIGQQLREKGLVK